MEREGWVYSGADGEMGTIEYYYAVGWSWIDCQESKVFKSRQKLSKEEFEKLIGKLIAQAAEELLKTKTYEYIGNDEIIESVWKLLPQHGFEEVKYQVEFNLPGGPIIGEHDMACRKYLDEELFKKICEHNRKVPKELKEELNRI